MEQDNLNIADFFDRQVTASEFGVIEIKTMIFLLLIFALLFSFFFIFRKYFIPYLGSRKSVKKAKKTQFRIEVIVWTIFGLFSVYQLLADSLYITLVLLVLIALVAKNFWMDLFAGIAFKLENKFEVNDPVRFEDYDGSLEKISLRNIQIKTDQQEVVVVPFRKISASIFIKRQAKGKLHSGKITLQIGDRKSENIIQKLDDWVYQCPWAVMNESIHAKLQNDQSITFTVYATDSDSLQKIENYLKKRLKKMPIPTDDI